MDQTLLAKKRDEITTKFNELRTQTDQKISEVTANEDELKRLQGEFRALESLVAEATTQKVEAKSGK